MTELRVTRQVDAPVERVWELITDVENSKDTISAITEVERLDDGTTFDVGTRWKETRVMFGKEASEEMEVVAIEPGHSYTVAANSRGMDYTSVMSVEPSESGAALTMSFAAEPTGALSKVFASTIGRMFEGGTRKAIEQDLIDIAAAAEAD